MSTTAATQSSAFPRNARFHLWWRYSGLLLRLGLVAAAVIFSYAFRWEFLRSWTADANLALDRVAGVYLVRVSRDAVLWHGILFRYENACTFIDVWFGSIPLLWKIRHSLRHNLLILVLYTAALFSFNIVRLSFSDVLFSWGLPWSLAHSFVSGVSYFVIWLSLWSRLQQRCLLSPDQQQLSRNRGKMLPV